MKDNADAWGMLVDRFENREGCFSLMKKNEAAKFANVSKDEFNPVRVTEDGPVRTVVEAYFKYNDSKLCLSYSIPKKGTEIDDKCKGILGRNRQDA